MSLKALAIKVKTKSGYRYFSGFGKSNSVQTAWHLAGAKLFLENNGVIEIISSALSQKKKSFVVITVSDTAVINEQLEQLIAVNLFLDETHQAYQSETDAYITALHAAIASGDLAKANALIESYDNDQIPF